MKSYGTEILLFTILAMLAGSAVCIDHKLTKIDEKIEQIECDIYCIERYLKEAI